MDALGAFKGVCGTCDGTGVFDETDGTYIIPLNDTALDKGIEVSSGDAGLQDDYDRTDYSQAQTIYHQMGRNAAKFMQRNTPQAYFDGMADKFAEMKGLSGKFTR